MKRSILLRRHCTRILIGCLVVILMLNVVFCQWPPQAPSRLKPTPDPTLAIDDIKVSESACIGQAVTITVKTAPGNECLVGVVYANTSGDLVSQKLKTAVADSEGLCAWTWWIPEDASVGDASVRTIVLWGDEKPHNLIPISFHIKNCSE
jgi:hypothetical protein